MKKTKYLFNPGRLGRKDNTLVFTPVNEQGQEGTKTYLPIEDVAHLYAFGSLDANSALFNFLGKQRVSVHFFDFYEHYTGSFMPKEYLWAGQLQVLQTQAYLNRYQRLYLATRFVKGATDNMLHILNYYRRKERPLQDAIAKIATLQLEIEACNSIPELMGIEGNCRQAYYACFDEIILNEEFVMDGRSKQPPKNAVNALISFGNMMCYTLCLDSIYHTQLNPTISFLHEPGSMRYSLALDIAEIFKPIFVDRTIFSLLNRRQLQPKHFEKTLNGVFLNDSGKKIFIEAYEETLKTTYKHKRMNRSVSYRTTVRFECHKIMRWIMTQEAYEPFVLGKHE